MSVVQRLLNKDGDALVEPRAEDGHGSSGATPSFHSVVGPSGLVASVLDDFPLDGENALVVRQAGGMGRYSTLNGTVTPLSAGQTWTGTPELNNYSDGLVSCYTDQAGLLYIDFSLDGVNWDSTLTFIVSESRHELHRIVKGSRYIRVRFENSSASNQTVLRVGLMFGTFTAPNLPLNATIQEDSDAAVVRTIDSELDIAAGRFTGYSVVNKYGTNSDIDTASVPEDVWEAGGVYTGFPSSAENIEILSSSAADASAGTGARTVRVMGLDADFNSLSETITLNGTTPAASVGQFIRVHTATVLSAGSGGVNAGTITVRQATTEANVFLNLNPGRNQSNCSAYTVPAGYTAYMRSLHMAIRGTAQANTPAAIEGNIWTRAFGGVFRSRRPFVVSSNYRLYDAIYGGIPFTEKSDIVLRVTASSGDNVSVAGGYDLLLVKNP
jgi:hypothetical protein